MSTTDCTQDADDHMHHHHHGPPSVKEVDWQLVGLNGNVPPTAQFQKVIFLGTGSAVPSPGRRNTSALAVILNNRSTVLMDCGEATQHQMMLSASVSPSTVKLICVTHLHGDHCFGLPGLLCTMSQSACAETDEVVIVGPRGIKQMITTTLLLSGGFYSYTLRFLELEPDTSYPDLGVFIDGSVHLQAYPLNHRVPAFGFVLTEATKAGALNAVKAAQLGARGKQLGQLKDGKDVTLPDGTVIRPADVVGAPTPGRRIALLQDTSDSSTCAAALQGVDLLIHECTYAAEFEAKAISHGHSTSAMAGRFAASVDAKMLVLTHFSNRYETRKQTETRRASVAVQVEKQVVPVAGAVSLDELASEAREAFAATHASAIPPAGDVHCAEDFTVIDSKLGHFVVHATKDC